MDIIDADNQTDEALTKDDLLQENQSQLDQVREKLKGVAVLVERSQGEVNRLAQRNTLISIRLGKVQEDMAGHTSEEIRQAYDAALENQQRMFMLRGQVEKLQAEKDHLQTQAALLERIAGLLERQPSRQEDGGQSDANIEMLEMLIQTQESERQRLSRQMHDGPAQSLSNFILQTEIALKLFDMDQEKAREELLNLKATASTAFQKVRDFIFELRPMMLDDLGLVPTVKRYLQAMGEHTGAEIRLTVTGAERRLESFLEVMFFRAVQEIVGIALHHNQATLVKVQLDLAGDHVQVGFEDDGRGLDMHAIETEAGMGLKVIKDRVEMLGGTFDLHNMPGQGARLSFQVPAAASVSGTSPLSE
jgi:two-component system, NarL family, sensor histidine kinase DegS